MTIRPAAIYHRIMNELAIILLKRQKVLINRSAIILGFPRVRNEGEIYIGDRVTIQSHPRYNETSIAVKTIIKVYHGGNLHIGSDSGISNIRISCRDSITIGENTLIGSDCKIMDSDMHPLDPINRRQRPNDPLKIKTKPIKIGNDVFIGSACIILKGAEIGDRSIIGAGSIVTCRIPNDQIWAGNPAQYIRSINPTDKIE